MLVYSALYSCYGLIWLVKHVTIPDATFDRPVTLSSAILMWAMVLGPYCVIPYLLASGLSSEISGTKLTFGLMCGIFGIVGMIASDTQKYFVLKAAKKPHLICDGFFKLTRNPNYLSEMLLYFGMATIVNHFVAYLIVFYSWLALFSVRIY